MSEHAAEAAHHVGEAGHHAAQGVHGFLGKRLGPMPMGGWLLAIAGGVAVAIYFRNRASSSSTSSTGGTTPDGYSYDPTTGQWVNPQTGQVLDPGSPYTGVGNLGSGGGGGNPSNGNPEPPAAAAHKTQAQLAKAATTNAGWLRHAEAAMVEFGFKPAIVQHTLERFLAGEHLSHAQRVVLEGTLPRVGPPPKPPTRQHTGEPSTGPKAGGAAGQHPHQHTGGQDHHEPVHH